MSSRRGKEAEFFFDMQCTKLGYDAAVPIAGDIESYDRVISRPGQWYWQRVQVKRVYRKGKNQSRTINLVRSNDKPYSERDFELLAAIDMETGDIWLIPVIVVTGYTRRRINKSWDRWLME